MMSNETVTATPVGAATFTKLRTGGMLRVDRAGCAEHAVIDRHDRYETGEQHYRVERPGEVRATHLRAADAPTTPYRRIETWAAYLTLPEAKAYAAGVVARGFARRGALLPMPAAKLDARSWIGSLTGLGGAGATTDVSSMWAADGHMAVRLDAIPLGAAQRSLFADMACVTDTKAMAHADVAATVAREARNGHTSVAILGCAYGPRLLAFLRVGEHPQRLMVVDARKLALFSALLGGLAGAEASTDPEHDEAPLLVRRGGAIVAALMPCNHRDMGADAPDGLAEAEAWAEAARA